MRFTNILDDILGHKSKIKILRYLVNSNLELTGRQLSRAIGIHHRTSHRALKEFTSFGIVVMHRTGKAILYKINDNNIIVKDILRQIFGIENNLLTKTVKTIVSDVHVKVISVILFGSIAFASERGTSDIDLLFLVNSKRQQKILKDGLDKIEYNFILKYGNMLSALVLTLDDFYRRVKKGDKLMENIIQKGKSVYGKSVQEVLIECQQKK